ncbi:MAG: hypothetical protein AAF264_05360 [Pseudomonadota bacterium]
MPKIPAIFALCALLGGCASYTEETSPCVCIWEPIGVTGEAIV